MVQRVNTIPPQLVSNKLLIQFQHDCNLICNASSTTAMSITGAEFATCTRQATAVVHPCSVKLSVNFTFYPMSVFGEAVGPPALAMNP